MPSRMSLILGSRFIKELVTCFVDSGLRGITCLPLLVFSADLRRFLSLSELYQRGCFELRLIRDTVPVLKLTLCGSSGGECQAALCELASWWFTFLTL